jgi:Activator of Hsp90 ATPase homolog 1-like protein
MEKQDYTATLVVDATAQEVFNNINAVSKWWTDELKGSSQKQNDEFTVQFADMHLSTQKIVELIPGKKVVWLVTESNLSFIKEKDEWTNTTISFEIAAHDNKTQLSFTHFGLVPQIECFKDCSKGWDYYIKGSLFKLLTEGKGTPGL